LQRAASNESRRSLGREAGAGATSSSAHFGPGRACCARAALQRAGGKTRVAAKQAAPLERIGLLCNCGRAVGLAGGFFAPVAVAAAAAAAEPMAAAGLAASFALEWRSICCQFNQELGLRAQQASNRPSVSADRRRARRARGPARRPILSAHLHLLHLEQGHLRRRRRCGSGKPSLRNLWVAGKEQTEERAEQSGKQSRHVCKPNIH